MILVILGSLEPAAIKKVAEWAAAAGTGEWVITALFWLVPLWLAFVTMTVNGSSNRWANFVVAVICTILNIYHFFLFGVPFIKGGALATPTAHHILLVGSTVVATALVAWYAWKWPNHEE
jgi:hypothetical protein